MAMPRSISDEGRRYFEQLHTTPAFGASGNFDLKGLRVGMSSRREPADESVCCMPVQVDHMPCEWVVAEGADPDVRLLYLHGGGYVSGSGAYYLPLAAHISRAAGCAVLLLDYRLAPEDPFPAALQDSMYAHDWLQKTGPNGPGSAKATFVGGDSAGGGLTLATLLALRDEGRPLPTGGIALSAFTDLTLSGASLSSEAAYDPIMSPLCLPHFVNCYLGNADAHHPHVSPAFGDYTGIPPLLFQVGEHEIIRDDTVMAAAKARADGVQVTEEIWPGMFHVFHSHEPLIPEGRDAVEHIADFAGTLLA